MTNGNALGEGRRFRDFPPEPAINLNHQVVLDGPDQPEATSITINEMIAYFDQFITGDGDGNGGSQLVLNNVGTGVGVHLQTVGSVASLRTLRSSTSPLSIIAAGNEIHFSIGSASPTISGLMSGADKAKLDGLPSQIVLATPSVNGLMSSGDKAKLDGLPQSIPLASAGTAGLMSPTDKVKLDNYPETPSGGDGTQTTLENIGTGAGVFQSMTGSVASLRSLRSSTSQLAIAVAGNEINFTIGLATSVVSGFMSAADKAKMDNLPSSLGPATPSQAGTMSASDKSKLDGLPQSIPLASAGGSGLMSPTDKVKLDNYPTTPPSGGTTTTLQNVGPGSGVFQSQTGSVASLRSLRSTTSPLAILTGTDEITFSVANATAAQSGLMSASDKSKLDTFPATLGPATPAQAGTMSAADKSKLDALPQSIPLVTAGAAGFMSPSDKTKLDAYPATPPSGGTSTILQNLGSGAPIFQSMVGNTAFLRSLRSTTSPLAIATSADEITFTISLATSSQPGMMGAADKAKLDSFPASLGPATPTTAGIMSAADKTKLDGLPGSIPLATAGAAGLMPPVDKAKLDTYPASPANLPVASPTLPGQMSATDKAKLDGYPAILSNATQTVAGLMSAPDKTKLDNLPTSIVQTTLGNVGTGAQVFKGRNGTVDELRTLKSNSSAFGVAVVADEVQFSIATVTTASPGIMTAADKTKLDALEIGGVDNGQEPVAPFVDLTINDNTVTTVNLATDTPEGSWFIIADTNDVEVNALVIVDFTHGAVGIYSIPGKGEDLVAAYGLYTAATGALTGTGGTAGKINISATADYNIYINNRTGSNRIMRFFQPVAGSGGGAVTLGQLADVSLTSLVNGYVLTYNQTIGKWIAAAPTGGTDGEFPTDPVFNSVTVGDDATGQRARNEYITTTESYQINVNGLDQTSSFEIFASGELTFNGTSLKPSLDLTTTLMQCQTYRDEALAARDESQNNALLASRWASNPLGQPVQDTRQSAFAYSQIAAQNALISRVIPAKVIDNTMLVSNKYTLLQGDLFMLLIFRNTADCELVCPPNLWRTNIGEAWVMVRREGALVTAVAATGVSDAPLLVKSRSIVQRFGTPLAGSTDVTEVITVPALTNAKICVAVNSVHATTGTKNLNLVNQPSSGITFTNMYNEPYIGGNEHMKMNEWQADLASFAGGDVSLRLTLPAGCSAAVGTVLVVNNAGAREDSNRLKSVGVTSTQALSITTNSPGARLVLCNFAQRSNTGFPAFLTGGLFGDVVASTIGVSPGGIDDRFTNICCLVGQEMVPIGNTLKNYSAVFNSADGPTTGMIWAYPAATTATISSTIRAAGGDPTIQLINGQASLQLNPDGVNYFWNAG